MITVDIAIVAGSADQDRAAALAIQAGHVLVVADGAGGMGGGAEAADAVIEAVQRAVRRGRSDWVDVLASVDLELADRGRATAVVAEVRGGSIEGASAGDSIAWSICDDACVALTAGQRRKPLIGSGRAVVTPFRGCLQEGGALLLATDGLHRYAGRDAILAAIGRGATAAELVDLSRLPAGALQDDVAVVLARGPRAPARMPTSERPRYPR